MPEVCPHSLVCFIPHSPARVNIRKPTACWLFVPRAWVWINLCISASPCFQPSIESNILEQWISIKEKGGLCTWILVQDPGSGKGGNDVLRKAFGPMNVPSQRHICYYPVLLSVSLIYKAFLLCLVISSTCLSHASPNIWTYFLKYLHPELLTESPFPLLPLFCLGTDRISLVL